MASPAINPNKLINCTPHPLNFYIGNECTTIPCSNYSPRVMQEPQKELGKYILENGKEFPILDAPTYGEIEGLPENNPNNPTDIVVSMVVAERLKTKGWHGRVFTPDTSPAGVVRDEKYIIGTKHLIQYV